MKSLSYTQSADHFKDAIVQEEYTVSQLSMKLKSIVEGNFSDVRIKGEVSGAKMAASGHLYFTLKDEQAVISAVCWKSVSLPFNVEDGMEVICSGKISIYAGRSTYQVIIKKIELAGIGEILRMLEKRRKKLEAEGLFSSLNKQKIPYLPETIGVITSSSGAVIKDIIHRLEERCPVRVIVWNVPVQGTDAARMITNAIDGFNKLTDVTVDVIIVARGGGSIEDLLPFSEEELVRAAAKSKIPIISAVGHETDFSLLDYASDLRAPTPTAAAEKAVPVRRELLEGIGLYGKRMKSSVLNLHNASMIKTIQLSESLRKHVDSINNKEKQLTILSDKVRVETLHYRIKDKISQLNNIATLSYYSIYKCVNDLKSQMILLKVDFKEMNYKLKMQVNNLLKISESLSYHIDNIMKRKDLEIKSIDKLVESYHYKNVLKRGFALVWDEDNNLISSTQKISDEQEITVELQDGKIKSKAIKTSL